MSDTNDDRPVALSTDSPSGTVLAHTGSGTNWVLASQLVKVIKGLLTLVTERPLFGINDNWRCKYVNIRIDMRSGHFVITDNDGKRIDGEDEVLQKLMIK
jgi:hypothetical protein